MKEIWPRVRALLGRRALEDGLDEELRFHLDQQTARNRAAGMSESEARRQARLRFGGLEGAREATRDEVRFAHAEDTWRDLRYAWRALRRAPAFTVAAAATLSLGVGATAAIFSVVYGVLIKPLPYPNEDRLVNLSHQAPGIGADDMGMAGSLWMTYRDTAHTFEAVGLWQEGVANVVGRGGPQEVRRVYVTHDALYVLGVQPVIGRWFSPEDDAPGAPRVVLLSHGYWQRQHGGDASIVGQHLVVNGEPSEVVGIMPRGFRVVDADADIVLPTRLDRATQTLGGFGSRGVARLRPGVTLDQARADAARLIETWLSAWPVPPGLDASAFANARIIPVVAPLKDAVVGDVGRMLWVVMATVFIVWLIACANVANLLLVRAESRQQEIALRAALGAGTRRIARALLAEHVLLGLIGGVLGMGVAYAALRLLVVLEPVGLPRVEEIGVDAVVVVFVMIAAGLSSVLFGVLPIVRHARPRVSSTLRGTTRTASDGRDRLQARHVLVVGQVALALVLLACAGLMVRTFQALQAVDPGFSDPQHVQTLRLSIPAQAVDDPEQVTRMQQSLAERMAALPGVDAVSFASSPPLTGTSWDPVFPEGQTYPQGEVPPVRRYNWVAPGYFATLGTPVVAGREFTWAELYERHPVAIVSEGLARTLWGDPSRAVGRRIRESDDGRWREVVGVVGDVHDEGPHQPAPPTAYWPTLQDEFWGEQLQARRTVTFVVRSSRTGTDGLLEGLRAVVREAGGGVPIGHTQTLGAIYERSMAPTAFALVMLAIAAGMALLLGVIGIYGVIAYAVARRTREIGIRLALGARETALRVTFVGDGVRLAAVGVACGLLAAWLATRLMTSLLFGVDALDPITYAAGAVVLLTAAAAASFVPAVRATRAPLADVLRAE